MFHLECHHCGEQYLVGSRSVRSIHHTSAGRIAYVVCPQGHNLVLHFTRDAEAGTATGDTAPHRAA